ncbi:imidazolonepropionase [Actinomycetospora termitidis]|uniref:Imidazolonepropionase n=1 Tax=Actinomycetospora termitidis TaxID=3053470 RepID=A0ABT7M8Q7_9PSEU|nr:imidazolonepropionase [Actinomycetospora sp. Odt1-22]MDL5157056.1 imidazolonepropionase [Actinomycetospora sp. Odt1-22]
MSVLHTGIGELVTNDPAIGDGSVLGLLHDAALVTDGDRVAWVGPAARAPAADHRVDHEGDAVVPGFVDSHAHLVFAGERSAEFAARASGRPYTAGGIRTTVAATRAASDEALAAGVASLARELLAAGVTTFETKSGYGLTVDDERRALEIAGRFTPETTYLGAHVVPAEYADHRADYVDLVCGPMLDACAPHARWVDVFCETGAFDVDEARAVLEAGRDRGLGMRVHAGQLGQGEGVRLAVDLGAAAVDHCTYLSDDDVEGLAAGPTVATLLPGVEFSTRTAWADGRRLLDAGAMVALATDCNPGSSYTSNIAFCLALAVRHQGLTPAEALHAATAGGAAALRRPDVGSLVPGARADLVRLAAPSYVHLAYRPGVPLVREVWRGGVPSEEER